MARDDLEDLGVDRILKWIFKKRGGEAWPGLFWFWRRPGGGRLWMR